ncbi:hypothetical protein BH10ACI1_BH10ACI1_26690 [soil metagenome]
MELCGTADGSIHGIDLPSLKKKCQAREKIVAIKT